MKKKGTTDKDKETLYLTEETTIDDFIDSKFIAFYFSAYWCPPCRNFLGMLKDFYNEVNIDARQCEIIYVSDDKNEKEFQTHYAMMPWYAFPFGDPRIKQVKKKYTVVGVPFLIVVEATTGMLVTTRGRKDIHE